MNPCSAATAIRTISTAFMMDNGKWPPAIPSPSILSRCCESHIASGLQQALSAGMDPTAQALVNSTKNNTLEVYYERKFSFTLGSGFALLPLENNRTSFDSLNIVTADFLFHNGLHWSEKDISVPLVGVYEWKTGLGDAYVEEIETVLKRSYKNFSANRKPGQAEEEKIAEDKFVAQLRLEYFKYAKASSVQRPASAREASVTIQCPFTVVFHVKADVYMDAPPLALKYGPGGVLEHIGEIQGGGRHESAGGNFRYSEEARDFEHVRRPTFAQRPRTRSRVSQEQGFGEEEMVKMTGVFVSEQCKTKMNIELSTPDTETLLVKATKYTLLLIVVAFNHVGFLFGKWK